MAGVDLYAMQVGDKYIVFTVTDGGKMCIHDAPDSAKEILKTLDPANELHIFPEDLNKKKNWNGGNRKMGKKKGKNVDKNQALGLVLEKLMEKMEACRSKSGAKENRFQLPTVDQLEKHWITPYLLLLIFVPLFIPVLCYFFAKQQGERFLKSNLYKNHQISPYFWLLVLAPIYIPVIYYFGASIFDVLNRKLK
ncbi:unnamed protein product [Caenorhabditis nigoni]